ncbi:MAG: type III polyketide synthase [Desulfuromonas sp.]|nr:type III polyketide synthase [Desulfuromonas sp.]
MTAYLHEIAIATPEHLYRQEEVSLWMQELAGDDRQRRLLKALYRASGITTRHTVIPEFGRGFFGRDAHGALVEPGTGARNAIYARESRRLGRQAGEALLAARPDFLPDTITHVVTVSCTGFVNPGLDYFLVRDLGLPAATERYHLGFMGCYAAFPALRMAAQFCRADPNARVLVLCLELCSLHIQLGAREDQLLANALFADGAAAALVSSTPPPPGRTALRLDHFTSNLVPEGEAAMAWSIGDHGFDIALSSYVPRILGANINPVVSELLATGGHSPDDIAIWAVHPGGKAILDQLERSLGLRPEQLAPSRGVLRDFGNMSSATILFVLHDLLMAPTDRPRHIFSMAFGPGLTVEQALLTQLPGKV